jgi:hypothetical protein
MEAPRAPSLAVLIALACALPACRIGGERSVGAENDRLRTLAAEQEAQINQLKAEQAELRLKVAEASRAVTENIPAEVLEAIPRITSIDVSRLSGFHPSDPDAPARSVVIYFEPKDGRGRFVQAVGHALAEALILPSGIGDSPGAEPQRIASAELGPLQLRDAYRASVLGFFYTLELPLAAPVERSAGHQPTLIMRVEFRDGLTGEVHRDELLVPASKPLKQTPP